MRRLLLAAALAAGCHGTRASTTATGGTGCRAVAQAADRFVARAPEAEREATLRFAVEIIDLCQAPGLSPTTRKCVATAASPEDARACPALALVPLQAAVPAASAPPDDDDDTIYDFNDDVVDPMLAPPP